MRHDPVLSILGRRKVAGQGQLGQGSQESLPGLGTWRRPETSKSNSGLEQRALDRESDCVRSLVVFSTSSPMWEGSQSVTAGCWVVCGAFLRLGLEGGWPVDVRLAQDGTWSHGLVLGIVSWLCWGVWCGWQNSKMTLLTCTVV